MTARHFFTIPDWVKTRVPTGIKTSVKVGQFLLVYFGALSRASTKDTRRDQILEAVLVVRRDLEYHTCRVEPPSDVVPFLRRLFRIYSDQKDHQPGGLYRTGKIWEAALRKWRKNYLAALESGDAERLREVLRCFHRNDTIVAIGIEIEVLRDLFSKPFRSACFVTNLITKYQAFPRVCDPRFLPFVDEGKVGCPIGVPFDGQTLTPSGFRHAYYASEFSRAIDLDARRDLVICELGGGYANLPRILKQAHPGRSFTYVILDLPQMLPVAAYFLKANCPESRLGLWDELRDVPLSRSELRKYDFVLLPNWDIARLPDAGVDAVINTASLAEMDPDIVENYLEQIRRITARGGHFYTVNRDRGVEYPALDGTRETGMDVWNMEWPGWHKKMERPSWGDLHWGAWEQMDYKEVVLQRAAVSEAS